jgi:hypothetical protein
MKDNLLFLFVNDEKKNGSIFFSLYPENRPIDLLRGLYRIE